MPDNHDLSRRKILGGIVTIGAAGAAAGAGTMAYFSDTETSSGNQIQAGTLDLTPDDASGFSFTPSPMAPGATMSTSVDLVNSGTIDGNHLEFAASLSESDRSDSTDYNTDKSAQAVAEHLYVTDLTYDGSPVNWGSGSLATLTADPGAVVVDDMSLSRTADPDGGSDTVLHANGTGYGISMRDDFSVELQNIESGDVTFDWYAASSNAGSAPDELFAVVNASGTSHLLWHTANYSSTNDTVDDETWRTIDVGTEMGLASGTAYNPNYNWPEIDPNSSTTYPDPSSGGLTGGSPAFDGAATLEALGFGVGNFGSAKQKDVYYRNLNVGSTGGSGTTASNLSFNPLTLYDVVSRGVADGLPGLAADNTESKTFEMSLEFDSSVGNAFQNDGVTVDFSFGLAQTSGQDVL